MIVWCVHNVLFCLREWSEEDRTCGAIIVGRVALSEGRKEIHRVYHLAAAD